MKIKDKLTVLVCSSDGYEDLWHPFFKLFEKNWEHFNCRLILNTETKKTEFSSLNIETFSFYNENDILKVGYGERMINHLSKVETEFVFLMLDDFFLRDKVDCTIIEEYLEIMLSDSSISSINFDPTPRGGSEYSQDSRLIELPQIAPYKLNMQAGIWRTDALLKYWNKLDSPWQWEIFGNYDTFSTDDKFLHISSLEYSPVDYGFVNGGWGVYRGKWVVSDVDELFSRNEINIDYLQRGIFDNDPTALFNDKKALTSYLIKRLRFKYFVSFMFFKLRKKMGQLSDCRTHTEYLARK
ncbi:MAG: hypothetical protein RR565_03835 [Erysipelothrix sp.]